MKKNLSQQEQIVEANRLCTGQKFYTQVSSRIGFGPARKPILELTCVYQVELITVYKFKTDDAGNNEKDRDKPDNMIRITKKENPAGDRPCSANSRQKKKDPSERHTFFIEEDGLKGKMGKFSLIW